MTNQVRLPLAGCRVIDLGIITAGASTSALLADLGADVIKIESASYLDPFREWDRGTSGASWWNQSPLYRFTNRNKRGVSADLKSPAGRDLVLALVTKADIVVENFRRGVMERIGLDYEALRTANRKIVLASISSQGNTGPERNTASFGSTLDATSGLAYLTGYIGGRPEISGRDMNYPDQVVSIFSTGVIIAAVLEARRTGTGAHLDISQRELSTFMLGEEILAAGAGLERTRSGNASDEVFLQDCFPARDGWLAVTVSGPGDAESLCRAMGAPGMANLRTALTDWISVRDTAVAAAHLCEIGIPAAPVFGGDELLHDAGVAGGHALTKTPNGEPAKGFPFQLRTTPMTVTRQAPDLGEHTEEVLREILGLSAADLARLTRDGVVANVPLRSGAA